VRFNSFKEFYPFYLSEHSHSVCRRLHYVGSTLVLILVIYVFFTGNLQFLCLLPLIGYGFAWIGHFMFEKNRPATFKYPLYSFLADWVMLKDAILSVFGLSTPLDQFSQNSNVRK